MPVFLCVSMYAHMYDLFICICDGMNVGGVYMHEQVCIVCYQKCMYVTKTNEFGV